MDGVTILQTINNAPIVSLIILGVIMCVAMIVLWFVSLYFFDSTYADDRSILEKIFIPVFLFFMIGLLFIGSGVDGYDSPTYKVTISDTVSYNEFTAKYDVIKTEGKILTIRLKDDSKENNKIKEYKEDE